MYSEHSINRDCAAKKPYFSIRGTDTEFVKLQRAWTKSGKFANRSQFVKAAINAYTGEKIFD